MGETLTPSSSYSPSSSSSASASSTSSTSGSPTISSSNAILSLGTVTSSLTSSSSASVSTLLSKSSTVSSTSSNLPTLTSTPSSTIPRDIPYILPSVSSTKRMYSSSISPRLFLTVTSTATTRPQLINWNKLHYISGEIILQNITLTADQFLESKYWSFGQQFRYILSRYLSRSIQSIIIIGVHNLPTEINKLITEQHPINLYTGISDKRNLILDTLRYNRKLPYLYNANWDIFSLFHQPQLAIIPNHPSSSSRIYSIPYPITTGIGICFRIVTSQWNGDGGSVNLSQDIIKQLTNIFTTKYTNETIQVSSVPTTIKYINNFFYDWLHPYSSWLWNISDLPIIQLNNESLSNIYNNYDLYILLSSSSLVIHEPNGIIDTTDINNSNNENKTSLFIISLISVSSILGLFIILGIIVRYYRYHNNGLFNNDQTNPNVTNTTTVRIDYNGLWSPENKYITNAEVSISRKTDDSIQSEIPKRRKSIFINKVKVPDSELNIETIPPIYHSSDNNLSPTVNYEPDYKSHNEDDPYFTKITNTNSFDEYTTIGTNEVTNTINSSSVSVDNHNNMITSIESSISDISSGTTESRRMDNLSTIIEETSSLERVAATIASSYSS